MLLFVSPSSVRLKTPLAQVKVPVESAKQQVWRFLQVPEKVMIRLVPKAPHVARALVRSRFVLAPLRTVQEHTPLEQARAPLQGSGVKSVDVM